MWTRSTCSTSLATQRPARKASSACGTRRRALAPCNTPRELRGNAAQRGMRYGSDDGWAAQRLGAALLQIDLHDHVVAETIDVAVPPHFISLAGMRFFLVGRSVDDVEPPALGPPSGFILRSILLVG